MWMFSLQVRVRVQHVSDGPFLLPAGAQIACAIVFVARVGGYMAFSSLQAVLGFLLVCASAGAGAMPDINVQYESASPVANIGSSRSKFAKRASQLAASIAQADLRISEFSDLLGHTLRFGDRKQMPASFLSSSLQPVDAGRVRKSLAATEPMVSPAQAAVNVVEGEDVVAIMQTAKYKGMLDQIAQLEEAFESDIAALAGR